MIIAHGLHEQTREQALAYLKEGGNMENDGKRRFTYQMNRDWQRLTLVLGVGLGSLLAILLLGSLTVAQQQQAFRDHWQALGNTLAVGAGGALVRGDFASVQSLLATLLQDPSVVSANLRAQDGQVIAPRANPIKRSSNESAWPTPDLETPNTPHSRQGTAFDPDRDRLIRQLIPVTHDGKPIGMLQLQLHQSSWLDEMRGFISLGLLVGLLSVLLTHRLSKKRVRAAENATQVNADGMQTPCLQRLANAATSTPDNPTAGHIEVSTGHLRLAADNSLAMHEPPDPSTSGQRQFELVSGRTRKASSHQIAPAPNNLGEIGSQPLEARPFSVRRERGKSSAQVLIVDADKQFRRDVRRALQAQGLETCEVESAAEALQLASRTPPDAILLAADLPAMTGPIVCRQLRQDPRLRQVPVLITLEEYDVELINRALHAGVDEFVAKPLDYPQLVERLRLLIQAHNQQRLEQDQSEYLSAAQRIARLGYWIWHPQDARMELSPHLLQLLQLEQDQVPTTLEQYMELVHPEDRERVAEHFCDDFDQGQTKSIEYRMLRPAGDLYVRQHAEPRQPSNLSKGVIGAVQDVSHQQVAEQKMRRLAYYDNLTGLASRSYLMQRLSEAVATARRDQQRLALLFLDLDGFKDINDSLGHDVGDRMLALIGRRLKATAHGSDFIARLGGDEFCLLVDDVKDDDSVTKRATRLLEKISEPMRLTGRRLRPQASVGIAFFPQDADSMHDLLRAADSAMYAAKVAGKHRYVFFNTQMTEQAERRLAQEEELYQAAAEKQFRIHYQPLIDTRTQRAIGFEALLRWQHPTRGLLGTEHFIASLERIGLMPEVSDWVLREACRQTAEWQKRGFGDLCVAVNISPRQLGMPNFAKEVLEALDSSGLQSEQLVLDIHEQALHDDMSRLGRLRELHLQGVQIAIDNFGSGMTQLGSLRDLPMSWLKVDRGFVNRMLRHREDSVLLGTAVGLAFALGYRVVAEGVETPDQVRALSGFGCHYAQGHLFSEPVPPAQVPELILRTFDANTHTDHRPEPVAK